MKIPIISNLIAKKETPVRKKVRRKKIAKSRQFSIRPMTDRFGVKVNFDTFYTIYRRQADVYACIRELKEGIGATGYHWEDDEGNAIENNVTAELDRILDNIEIQSWRELKELSIRDLELTDNVYWHLVPSINGRDIAGIDRLDPRTMRIVSDKNGNIYRYIQTDNGSNTETYEPSEILHIRKDRDTANEVFGLSPLEAVVWDALTDMEAQESNHAMFKNSAQPAAWFILDDGLDEKAQEDAMEQIANNLKGSKNKGKSAALSGVKDIKILSVSNKDMEYILGRKLTTEKVCSIYGTPKFLLGYTDTVNNNNADQLLKKYYTGTIKPKETFWEEVITRGLLPRLGVETGINYKFNPQQFDEQGALEKRALEEVAMGILTRKQYKIKTGQEIYPEDEKAINFDVHILGSSNGAVLLTDVGINPDEPTQIQDKEVAANALKIAKYAFKSNKNTGKSTDASQ